MSNRGDIIVPQQDQIEVYAGDSGYIVIKQTSQLDDPAVITFSPTHAKEICDAIMAALPNAVTYRADWIAEGDNDAS